MDGHYTTSDFVRDRGLREHVKNEAEMRAKTKVSSISTGKMTRVLIGIAGRAHAGKDTFAKFVKRRLYEKARLEPRLYAFAAPIKRGLKAMFGWSDEQLDGSLKDAITDLNFSPRLAMQTLGTQWGKNLMRVDVWIELANRVYTDSLPHGLIVTDVRFDDEADWIRSEGGIVVRLLRSDTDEIAEKDHSSEYGVDLKFIDYSTDVCESITDLEIEAIRFSEYYMKQRKGDK